MSKKNLFTREICCFSRTRAREKKLFSVDFAVIEIIGGALEIISNNLENDRRSRDPGMYFQNN